MTRADSRRELLALARGLWYGAKCEAVARPGKYTFEVNGLVVGEGTSWAHAYADMRRRIDQREREREQRAST